MALGMAAVFFEIQVPDFVLKPLSIDLPGDLAPGLVFIGSVIRNMDLKTITLGRDLYAALAMRFVVVPAACVVFLNLVPVPKEMKEVFFMLSSMPAMPDGHYGPDSMTVTMNLPVR